MIGEIRNQVLLSGDKYPELRSYLDNEHPIWVKWAIRSRKAEEDANDRWYNMNWGDEAPGSPVSAVGAHDSSTTSSSGSDDDEEEEDDDDEEEEEEETDSSSHGAVMLEESAVNSTELVALFDKADAKRLGMVPEPELQVLLEGQLGAGNSLSDLVSNLGVSIVERADFLSLLQLWEGGLGLEEEAAVSEADEGAIEISAGGLVDDMLSKAVSDVSDIFLEEGAISGKPSIKTGSPRSPGRLSPKSGSPKSRSPESYHAISPKSSPPSPGHPAVEEDGYEAREIEQAIEASSPKSSPKHEPSESPLTSGSPTELPANLTEEAPWNPF